MCAALRRWRDHQQRELPWLAGGFLSAVGRAGVSVASTPDLRAVQRFLVGAEADADAVGAAINGCLDAAGEPGPAVAPDARGALVQASDHYLELLTTAYTQLHQPVRTGHRRDADDVVRLWQTRLDDAADAVDERAKVLTGERPTTAVPRKPARGTRDRPGCALGFVAIALLAAAALVWAVLNGWPVEPLPFDL